MEAVRSPSPLVFVKGARYEKLMEAFGGVDVLINNAGIGELKLFDGHTPEQLAALLNDVRPAYQRVIAAMEAQAFVENDLQKLIDAALRFIPSNSSCVSMDIGASGCAG